MQDKGTVEPQKDKEVVKKEVLARSKRLEKPPTKKEILAEKYYNVILKMNALAKIIDDNHAELTAKMNLQGSSLVGVIEHVSPTLPELEEAPETAIHLWGEVWLEKNKLYAIRKSDASGKDTTEGE